VDGGKSVAQLMSEIAIFIAGKLERRKGVMVAAVCGGIGK